MVLDDDIVTDRRVGPEDVVVANRDARFDDSAGHDQIVGADRSVLRHIRGGRNNIDRAISGFLNAMKDFGSLEHALVANRDKNHFLGWLFHFLEAVPVVDGQVAEVGPNWLIDDKAFNLVSIFTCVVQSEACKTPGTKNVDSS